MSIIAPATLKKHIRVDHTDEDTLIQTYLDAAEAAISQRIQRPIVADNVIPEGDEVNMTWDLQAAVLLLAGHLYENREAVVVGATTATLPMACEYLLAPYRLWAPEATG